MLEGKTIYAIGDSIVAGHLYPQASFVDVVSHQARAVLVKAAVNGATVRPSTNTIADQICTLPTVAPDFILFDGGTNDAYVEVLSVLGVVTEDFDGPFDLDTFAGAFESLIERLKSRYPGADLIYVAVHKLGARDMEIQELLHNLELLIAKKWGVAVADVYASDLDTSNEVMRVTYSFDSLQPSGTPGTIDTTGSWGSGDAVRPTGTHPNFPAIKEYYAPIVSETLHRVQESRTTHAVLP